MWKSLSRAISWFAQFWALSTWRHKMADFFEEDPLPLQLHIKGSLWEIENTTFLSHRVAIIARGWHEVCLWRTWQTQWLADDSSPVTYIQTVKRYGCFGSVTICSWEDHVNNNMELSERCCPQTLKCFLSGPMWDPLGIPLWAFSKGRKGLGWPFPRTVLIRKEHCRWSLFSGNSAKKVSPSLI